MSLFPRQTSEIKQPSGQQSKGRDLQKGFLFRHDSAVAIADLHVLRQALNPGSRTNLTTVRSH